MTKKLIMSMFSLIFGLALMAPNKANAQVVVGVGPVVARPYVYVAPRPYYYRGYAYPYRVYVGPHRYYPYRYYAPRYYWR
jgi:hypothetical protein